MNKQNKYLKFGLIALGVVLLLSFVSVYGANNGAMTSGMNGVMSGLGNMMNNGMMEEMGECHEAMESGGMGKMGNMMQKHMGWTKKLIYFFIFIQNYTLL